MTKLEQFVALMEEKYNHPITIDGDKLIVDKQTSENMYEKYGVKSNIHAEIDTKVFDLSDLKNDMHRFYYIVESYMLYDLFLYAGDPENLIPVSDFHVVANSVDDVVLTFTMANIDVKLDLSMRKGIKVEKTTFIRNGQSFEVTYDGIPLDPREYGIERVQYVLEHAVQL
jgi:hypothetical protein